MSSATDPSATDATDWRPSVPYISSAPRQTASTRSGSIAQLEFRRLVRNFARERFGPDKGTNRLHAECIDEGDETLLRLYVDGVRQSEARHSGRVGRFIGIGLFLYSQSGGTDVRFDDVVVRPP